MSSPYAQEKAFLNQLYTAYTLDDAPQTQAMRRLVIQTMQPFVSGGVGLELGCSDGYMTEMLSKMVDTLHVVDASEGFIKEARERGLPNVSYFCDLFEEYESPTRYDVVFASFILEHVLEVGPVLAMAKKLLKPNGRLCVVVPNARALSRQLAQTMGLVKELYDLTENDKKFGHRRVYDRIHLTRDLEQAGFKVTYQCGIMLKILADFQLDQLLGQGFLQDMHVDGLYRLGLEYPDLCGALFALGEPVS